MGLNYDPWRHAKEIEIPILYLDLPKSWRGGYQHEHRRIILVPGMSYREARSTLAHEIQHALAGDIPSPFGFITHRQEILANRRAAELLIDPIEYALAEDLRDGHQPSIAHDLNVTIRVLKNWRSSLESHQPTR